MAFAQETCNVTNLLDRIQAASLNSAVADFGKNENGTLCSSVLSYLCDEFLDSRCTKASDAPTEEAELTVDRPSGLEVWCFGLLAICMVCSCAIFGLCLFPVMKRPIFKPILTWMVGLAVGCLSGLAIFHLLPHCYETPSESPHHGEEYLHKSAAILGAIYFFYIGERIFSLAAGHRKQKPKRGKQNPVQEVTPDKPNMGMSEDAAKGTTTGNGHVSLSEAVTAKPSGGFDEHDSDWNVHVHAHGGTADHSAQTVVWMILASDGIVNGLSIGAAFAVSPLKGLSIALAIICEEIPHKMGYLAILLNAGFSMKRATFYNCLAGFPCFVGYPIGVFLGELPTASSWIFALAAGMFIYISFVNMLPELTSAVENASKKSVQEGVKTCVIQNFGLLVGLILMYLLGRYAETISVE